MNANNCRSGLDHQHVLQVRAADIYVIERIMKKKIAVFANGWATDNLQYYIDGLNDSLDEGTSDIYVYLGHDAYGLNEGDNDSEICIYDLPDPKDFDGCIFVAPGMDFDDVNDRIIGKWGKSGKPFISIGKKIDGAISIYTDNYEGMKPLIDHLIKVHDVKKLFFIAGPKDNKDSNDRLRAVIDSCRGNGVSFGEEDILYSNWDVFASTNYIREHFSHGEPLPDVIICANDNTAVFVSFVLEEIGIFSPDDVLITGFDGTNRGKNFYPSLTSVEQPFKEMGIKTGECFMSIFAGKSVESEYYIPCKFSRGESCGCDSDLGSDIVRRRMCRQVPREAVLADFRAGRIHYMENAVLKSERYSTLGTYLREFFYDHDGQEGNPFYIFLDPSLSALSEREISDMPEYTMPDPVDMLVGKCGDTHYGETMRVKADGMLPYNEEDTASHVYVFMPLYIDTYVCGYMVMADHTEYLGASVFSNFKSSFNRILETYRKNLKLRSLNDRLSELLNQDPMTLTKNRVAYENYKLNLNDRFASGDATDTAFVMFDINNLKLMNDTYGHEKGDEYIKNSCRLICDTFARSIVFRIGGDEFVAVLQGRDFKNRERLLKIFDDELVRIAALDLPPEKKVSVAYGMAVYDRKNDASIDAAIKRADDEMYINKRKSKG